MKKKHIITISGRPGSGKSTTAKQVSSKLGYKHFSSGDLFRMLGKERGIDVLQANLSAEENSLLDHLVDGKLRDIGANEDKRVIDSRLAWHWMPNSFKVFLDLDLTIAADRIINEMGQDRLKHEDIPESPEEYAKILKIRLDSEARRYKALYGINPYVLSNYDLVVDTQANGIEQVIKLVLEGFEDWLAK